MAAIWICLCAFLNCAGWILSALHSLNLASYCMVIALGLAVWLVWRLRTQGSYLPRLNFRKQARRFRRSLPLAFLCLFALTFLGGLLHAPSNYDALAYRVPRVMHWLADEQWHWIHSFFHRLNTRACGIEWVSAPVILFTKSERWLFLINSASFALLPGLVFSVLKQLGASRRVAWQWMWLFPTGYSFLLQAGSIGNDLFGAVFALAAVRFALCARTSGKTSEVWLSLLAAALLTGSKASNLPLALPCFVALVPVWRLVIKRPFAFAAVGLVALLCSFAPMAYLNWRHSGDWSGTALEGLTSAEVSRPLLVGNNSVLLLLQNFVTPIFPMAKQWNEAVVRWMPPGMAEALKRHFEPAGSTWALGELQIEEAAGLGFGLSVAIAALVVLAAVTKRKGPQWAMTSRRTGWIISGATAVALLAFMANSGLSTIGRLATPYYPLLVAGLLVGCGDSAFKFRRASRFMAVVIVFLAGLLVVISPARPLWPARTILGALHAEQSTNPLLMRAARVYAVQGRRPESFAPVLKLLPPEATTLGFVSFDDPEATLWRPFGSRRILHVTDKDKAQDLERQGIRYILVSSQAATNHFSQPFDSWLKEINADVLHRIPLELRGSTPPVEWLLVRRRPGQGNEDQTNRPGA